MDISKFTVESPGTLVKLSVPPGEHAFIPHPLDLAWCIPEALIEPLVEAQQALGALDGAGRHMQNIELLLGPLRRREAIRSSNLEGTYATPEELLMYELDPRDPVSDRDPVNAWREVFNYSEAMGVGEHLLETIPLSVRLVREIHAKLLDGVRGADRRPGEIRNTQVHIGSGGRFVPPPPLELNSCLKDLEIYLNSETKAPPLIACFLAHYQFETIHPFHDGNGRVGRLLLALMIHLKLNLARPWLYMSDYFDRYKDEYIDNLFRVSTKGDFVSWLHFCLRGVKQVAEDTLDRMDALIKLRSRFIDQITEASGNARQISLIDRLYEWPAITVPQISEEFDVTYPTAKSDVEKFIGLGILRQALTKARPAVFITSEILQVAHRD